MTGKLVLDDWITADLRKVTGNQSNLRAIIDDWGREEKGRKLPPHHGILVGGLSVRSRPRIIHRAANRLLWVTNVPWDPDEKLSMWLVVSQFIRRSMSVDDSVREALTEEISRLKTLDKKRNS